MASSVHKGQRPWSSVNRYDEHDRKLSPRPEPDWWNLIDVRFPNMVYKDEWQQFLDKARWKRENPGK